jgi:hypothetical protein
MSSKCASSRPPARRPKASSRPSTTSETRKKRSSRKSGERPTFQSVANAKVRPRRSLALRASAAPRSRDLADTANARHQYASR